MIIPNKIYLKPKLSEDTKRPLHADLVANTSKRHHSYKHTCANYSGI